MIRFPYNSENFVTARKLYYYRERRKTSKNQLTTPSTNRRLQLRSQAVKNRRNRYNELNRKVNYRKYKMELTWIRTGKNRTENKDHHQNSQKTSFYIQHDEIWPHRHRSATITASQFTTALVLSRSEGDFEPSVEVFQQWASYAGEKEPKINQLVKGRKTRKVKTIENCRGKIVTKKWGNKLFNRQKKSSQKMLAQL